MSVLDLHHELQGPCQGGCTRSSLRFRERVNLFLLPVELGI